LYELQHGFRKGRSCETKLIKFIDDLVNNINRGQQMNVLIIDFHSLLTYKLTTNGICGTINQRISNWVNQRTQTVVIDGQRSRPVPVESGVPQGSVLGPSLFLYYINDLQEKLTSTVRLSGKILQEDLDKLADWEKLWCMKFHQDKCNVLKVTNRKKNINTTYHLHGYTLEEITTAKYLGVNIQNNLKWDTHISQITDKANRTQNFLRRNLEVSPRLRRRPISV
jgi:hypothetical protein